MFCFFGILVRIDRRPQKSHNGDDLPANDQEFTVYNPKQETDNLTELKKFNVI